MENEKQEEIVSLYIPIGITTRKDFFQGFGKAELLEAMVGIIIGGIIATIVYLFTKIIVATVFTLMIFVGGSIVLTMKNQINISIVDYVRDMIDFNKSNKVYQYRQLKEW